jgi:hypothetical protein
MIIMLKNPILKVDLSRFTKYIYFHEMPDRTKWVVSRSNIDLQNKIKLTRPKIYLYIAKLCMFNHNISNFQCELSLNTILTSYFQMYL